MPNVELISITQGRGAYWVLEPNVAEPYYREIERKSFVIPEGFRISNSNMLGSLEFYDEKDSHYELHTNEKTNQPYLAGLGADIILKPADLVFTKIKDLRRAVDLTQQEFADYFEMSRRTIEGWESGRTNPPDYLIKLMEYKLRNEGLLIGEIKENQE